MTSGTPPWMATFCSLPSAWKPTHCPLGEKNGLLAPSAAPPEPVSRRNALRVKEVFHNRFRLHLLWASWRQLLPSYRDRAAIHPFTVPAMLARVRFISCSRPYVERRLMLSQVASFVVWAAPQRSFWLSAGRLYLG